MVLCSPPGGRCENGGMVVCTSSVCSCRCATGGKIQASDRFCGKKLTNEIDPTHFEKLRTWNTGKQMTRHVLTVVVVVVVVFTLKTVLTSIQYPSLSYSSRQRNEFPWSLYTMRFRLYTSKFFRCVQIFLKPSFLAPRFPLFFPAAQSEPSFELRDVQSRTANYPGK